MEHELLSRIYLRHAYQYAIAYSKHPSTQLGCVLVRPQVGILIWGANKRIPNSDVWVSAEHDLLSKCLARKINPEECVLYSPWISDDETVGWFCACRFAKVILHKEACDVLGTPSTLIDSLRSVGITTEQWSGKVESDISVRLNDTDFHP